MMGYGGWRSPLRCLRPDWHLHSPQSPARHRPRGSTTQPGWGPARTSPDTIGRSHVRAAALQPRSQEELDHQAFSHNRLDIQFPLYNSNTLVCSEVQAEPRHLGPGSRRAPAAGRRAHRMNLSHPEKPATSPPSTGGHKPNFSYWSPDRMEFS